MVEEIIIKKSQKKNNSMSDLSLACTGFSYYVGLHRRHTEAKEIEYARQEIKRIQE